MTKAKIFIDCHIFDSGYQGTTTYLTGLYTEMIKEAKFEYYFASFDLNSIKKIFGSANHIHYIKYSSKNKYIRLLLDIPRLIKKYKIDYAHFQYVTPPFKYCQYITTIHDVLFLEYPQYFPLLYRIKNYLLFYYSAKKSDLVLTVSNYSKNQIQKYFNVKAIVIPNAVNGIYFQDYDKVKEKENVKQKFGIENYWLYISRWEPRKNHYKLLKIYLNNKYYLKYDLVFVGAKAIPCKEFDELYRSLDEDIAKKIHMYENLTFPELLVLVRAATLAAYPSIAEGFGIPPLETAAARIPTVCSNTSAMQDFIFFGKLLFNPEIEEEMCRAITYALNTNISNIELQDQIKKRYNWEDSAKILLQYL